MMRAAKIYSGVLLVAYLLLFFVSFTTVDSPYGAGVLLVLLLPPALALGVLFGRAPRWLAGVALLANCVGVCIGLYMVGDALPDLLGQGASPDAKSAALYLVLALFLFVIPCSLNTSALFVAMTRGKSTSDEAAG